MKLSALDSTTKAKILNALKSLSSNRTSVFIAHRLTTAMLCDEIIVLENGKVVEQGPHEFLLTKAGRYASSGHNKIAQWIPLIQPLNWRRRCCNLPLTIQSWKLFSCQCCWPLL